VGVAEQMSHISTGGGASLSYWRVKNFLALPRSTMPKAELAAILQYKLGASCSP